MQRRRRRGREGGRWPTGERTPTEQRPLGDDEGRVHDVVGLLVEAENAVGEEGAFRPFEPVQRDVPECSVAVGQKQPKGEAVGEEGEGDWSGGGGA
jgi:hypothetical protein